MLYKIDCTAAQEAAVARAEPVSPVFKMKKTREELREARKLLKENMPGLTDEREGQPLKRKFIWEYADGMAESLVEVTESDFLGRIESNKHMENGGAGERLGQISAIVADDTAAEEDDYESVEEDGKDKRRSDLPAYVVSHPWHIVDYHLYLCSAESGQTVEDRRNRMYLYDGIDCRPLSYADFSEDRSLTSLCFPGDQPQLLFAALPIADRQHFADRNPSFQGRHYVLGFDYDCKTLYARHFDWFPHDLSDIWCTWDSGSNVYTTTVPDLVHIMDTSLSRGEMHVGMGVLSSSPYCLALESNDDPGLEIVIATLWCQWLLDFSELLFKKSTGSLPDFQARLRSYVDQGRLILQRASYRAWFAVRDGYSREQYKCKTTINQYTNDLYTFEKSAEDGSLKGRPWTAPGLETCNQIRYNERLLRRKRVQQRLEDLFVVPEAEATENHERVLRTILAKTPQHPIDFDFGTIDLADNPMLSPSPNVQQDAPELSNRCSSPSSPEIATPATEPYEFEASAYCRVPLPTLLERALKEVQSRPELDTVTNRGHLGDLLTNMGIIAMQPWELRKENHGLQVEVQPIEDSPISGLLPRQELE
ncbi:hypothetical protein BJX61DRAFT_5981 [Aspergillus egyptiacus]|nr:hypothetical protein BJX61DRAFT_5981 [Aspergillus egyptiacus]